MWLEVTDVKEEVHDLDPSENDFMDNLFNWVEGVGTGFNCIFFVIDARSYQQKKRTLHEITEALRDVLGDEGM